MRNFTNANLISIVTGFGFARNTDAGMGDVRHGNVGRDVVHVRLYAMRLQHQASAAAAKAAKRIAMIGERLRLTLCGLPPTLSCFGLITAQSRQCLRPSWCLAGPVVSPASRIS